MEIQGQLATAGGEAERDNTVRNRNLEGGKDRKTRTETQNYTERCRM